MPMYRVTIYGRDYDAMADLVRKYEIAVFRHTAAKSDDGGYHVDATLDDAQIGVLQAAGYRIDRHEDVDRAGLARQAEVGQGDEYRPPGPE